MKALLKNLLLSMVSVVILFGLLEGLTRITIGSVSRTNYTPVPKQIQMRGPFPGVPYVLQPDGVSVQAFGTDPDGYFDEGATLTYRINSLGFRGRETTRQKSAGTFRIIGMGDSFTFGAGVRSEHTFLSVLEERLNDGRSDVTFEVLNFGVGGYDTSNEVSLLQHEAVDFDPDAVVICFFLNDTGGGGTAVPLNAVTERDSLPFWRRNSAMIDHLAARVERRQAVASLVDRYHESFADDAPGWLAARDSLRSAWQLSENHGFQLFLMIYPVLWNLSGDYPFADIHESIGSFAESEGIPTLDLLPAFDGYNGPELWAHPNNQHPNPVAHSIAGRALHEFLLQHMTVETTLE